MHSGNLGARRLHWYGHRTAAQEDAARCHSGRTHIAAERSEEHPKVYTRIDLEYVVTGNALEEEKVKHAIEPSQEKYCSVSAMLRKACPVSYSVRVGQV